MKQHIPKHDFNPFFDGGEENWIEKIIYKKKNILDILIKNCFL